jgi:uncharacterized membrane protein
VAIGVAIGVALGAAMDNMGAGIAIGVAIGWFFIPFITIPLGIALVYLAYRRARKTGWPRGAGTA